MVNAGFCAAEDGRKEASMTKRFGDVVAPAERISTDVAGSSPNAHGPALMRGRVQAEATGLDHRIAGPPHRRCHGSKEALVQPFVVGTPVNDHAAGQIERHAALWIREILRHEIPVDTPVGELGEDPVRRPRHRCLEHAPLELPRSWAWPIPTLGVRLAEVPVIEGQRLLEDGAVDLRADRHQRGVDVRHVVAPDQPGRVGEAVRVPVGG